MIHINRIAELREISLSKTFDSDISISQTGSNLILPTYNKDASSSREIVMGNMPKPSNLSWDYSAMKCFNIKNSDMFLGANSIHGSNSLKLSNSSVSSDRSGKNPCGSRSLFYVDLKPVKGDSVARSKSFQESSVQTPVLKNSRYFLNRPHPHHLCPPDERCCKSDFSLNVTSQNIEITIQDEGGIIETTYRGRSPSPTESILSDENVKKRHVLNRILKQMRRFSLGWRKFRCKNQRGEWVLFLNFHLYIVRLIDQSIFMKFEWFLIFERICDRDRRI